MSINETKMGQNRNQRQEIWSKVMLYKLVWSQKREEELALKSPATKTRIKQKIK